ncbi:MAG: Dam family site-specific DNA-(adenine-N6)-methyltransferase [Gammaproteobacteria bacterium]|nr:Dam family site-specific DNA-(adenine-N6)-methyltransferase [Gammaproteobacteria bacterium]
MINIKKVTPPIKYPGGKRFLVDHIQIIWGLAKCRRLVEPFSGGMAISLGIAPKNALLNDINPHIINFYESIRDGLKIELDMVNEEAFYYDMREKFNNLIKEGKHLTHESASIFYYLNRTGFNGLVRFNKSGLYNVPFGRYKKINYHREFPEVEKTIKKWKFACGDFSKLRINQTDFLYVDPPYDVEFRSYAGNNFQWEEQERLIKHLSKYSCPIVISNQATDRIVELYSDYGYKINLIDAPRMISCDGNRARAQEVLAIKNMTIKPNKSPFK